MAIIRRNNSIYAALGICQSVWNESSFIPHCLPDSNPHTVTNTKCRIDTVIPPDDGHIVARSMYRKEIKMLRKNLCTKLALFTRPDFLSGQSPEFQD